MALQTTTILYLLLAILLSIAFSWLLYFYKSKSKRRIDYVLFSLRALGFFLMLLLLISPTIERKEYAIQKPVLSISIDNSLSVKHFKKEQEVFSVVNAARNNSKLNQKFDVQYFQFDEAVKTLDSLDFSQSFTNIYKAIDRVEALHKESNSPMILITDGNQTKGNSYEFIKSNTSIYPIIIGDTIPKSDVRIDQLNVNKYSYLKNKFPVETRIFYEGNDKINSVFTIKHKGKTVFRKSVQLSPTNPVVTLTAILNSDKEGLQFYTASIAPIENEENTQNNSKSFSIEVLNEQTNILVLTSVLHPDVGMLKKSIETNKQRSVEIAEISNFRKSLKNYQLVILYQPTIDFSSVFEEIQKEKLNYFTITGTKTNWNFLNEVQKNYYKNSINQTEAYGAIFNNGFLTFGQKDVSFESFQPLHDLFGAIKMNTKYDALLFQHISGIQTQTPLLATFEEQEQKSAVLFGEGIWKWRGTSFRNTSSFNDFDAFLSNIIQYVASTKKRERLTLNYEKLFSANQPITIAAFYVDKNYMFDNRAAISLTLTNTDTNTKQNVPFSLQSNSFEAVLNNLPSGNYKFTVNVENQNISKSGQFRITDYRIEEQFSTANMDALKLLANNNRGEVFNALNINNLFEQLNRDNSYTSIQTSKTIQQELIDWKLILFLAISIFTIEWFTRKYFGMV